MKTAQKLLLLLLLLGTTTSYGQFNVQSAREALEDGDMKEAMEYMGKAMEKPDNKKNPKVWVYQGKIYQKIASSKDTAVQNLAEKPLVKAVSSFQKAIQLDEEGGQYRKQAVVGMIQLGHLSFNKGAAQFNEKNYEYAAELFGISVMASKMQNKLDTLAMHNMALCLENSGKVDTSLMVYRKLADLGYKGAAPYMRMAYLYQRQGKTDSMISVLQEGRKAYPQNVELINTLSNHYLRTKNYEKARKSLESSIQADPDNQLLYFNLGKVYDQLYQDMRNADSIDMAKVNEYFEKSIERYEKAIELDSSYTDAIYNLGALYYNEGAELNNKAGETDDQEQYEELKAKASENFEKAIPYLEKAHEQAPKDLATMSSLTQAYAQTDRMDKYKAMKKKLEAAQQ